MINILFRTREETLPSDLCLDTATSVYMSKDSRIIVETVGEDYISSGYISAADFEVLIRAAFMSGNLDLSDGYRFGVFDVYVPDEDNGNEDIDNEE